MMRFYRRLRLSVLLVLYLLVFRITGGFAEDVKPLATGDPAPPLAVLEWINEGLVSPDRAEVTVLVFWAPWCPLSRTVLGLHEQRQAELAQMGVCFLAITPEKPKLVRKLMKESGWNNLAVACDDGYKTFRAYMEASDVLNPPFAFIMKRDTADGKNRLLWRGLVANSKAEAPLDRFETALSEIIEDRYDLDEAIAVERFTGTVNQLGREIWEARQTDDLDRLETLVEQGEKLVVPAGQEFRIIGLFNDLGWSFATREGRTEQHISIALSAARAAVEAGGDKKAFVVDTLARTLFENGDIEEAISTQRQAVELARLDDEPGEYEETLAWYEDELEKQLQPEAGHEADSAPAVDTSTATGETSTGVEPDESPAKPQPWNACINAIFDQFPERILVVPEVFLTPELEKKWAEHTAWLKGRFYKHSLCKIAGEVSAEEKSTGILALYGTPTANPLTRTILEKYGIILDGDGVTVGDTTLPAEDPVLITCLPNPWNPALPVLIYTSYSENHALGLNDFFHGPTSFLLGRWLDDGSPHNVITTDYLVDRDETGSITLQLDLSNLGPATLTREQVAGDLDYLHDLLHLNYGGYDDLAWKLKAAGSSWSRRSNRFKERINKQDTWNWIEYFHLLRDYLDIVNDTHFSMAGRCLKDGRRAGAGFVKKYFPYFSDLRIHKDGRRFIVTAAPPSLIKYIGQDVNHVPIIDDPHLTVPGQPYLFPTLPEPDYLLGMLASPNDPPSDMTVTIGREAAEVALHRGKVYLEGETKGPWSLSLPPHSPLPVLEVRTMNPERLKDMPDSAEHLRDLPVVVLDLRGNGGGGDGPAMEWSRRFSGQKFLWEAGANLTRGETDPLKRWHSWFGSPLSRMGMRFDSPPAKQSYTGTLFVLIDRGIASSGETFTMLASQVNGAVVVGENTAGCVAYGNCENYGPLPAGKLHFFFGHTKFVVDNVRHNPEGMGYFPDYWLDVEDPVSFIARYFSGQK